MDTIAGCDFLRSLRSKKVKINVVHVLDGYGVTVVFLIVVNPHV